MGSLFTSSSDWSVRRWSLAVRAVTMSHTRACVRMLNLALVQTGECTSIYMGHQNQVNAIVFSDKYMYTSSDDGSVKEWQLYRVSKEEQRQAEAERRMYVART